jgi:hypothetical protein
MSTFWMDATERVVATFVEAFVGSLIVTLGAQQPLDKAALYSAGMAGIIAALAVVKVVAASLKGDPDSASLVE